MKALLCREFDPLEGLALEEVSSPIAGNGRRTRLRNATPGVPPCLSNPLA